MATDNEYLLKICVLSSASEHKDHFIQAFIGRKQWLHSSDTTLGVDVNTKRISLGETGVKLIIPNTSGEAFFAKLRPSYYRGATAATILFDKCDRQSFEDVPKWVEEFQRYIPPPVPIALVGLITQCEENTLEISSEEGHKLAIQLNMQYFESKSTDRQQISAIFSYLAQQVIES